MRRASSKLLSLVLRHRPELIGVTLDEGGWTDVDALLAALAAHGTPLTRPELDALVLSSDKQRFVLTGNRIRAAQGHSVVVDLGLSPVDPPPLLFHGTPERNVASILRDVPAIRQRRLAGRCGAADVPHTDRVIVGVGIDVVQVERLERALTRTPRLGDRLFTAAERSLRMESLAARFAAKEAVAKALGAPGGLRWQDTEVVTEPGGRPRLVLHGAVADEAAAQGIRTWHLSLSHDAGVATAVVVAES